MAEKIIHDYIMQDIVQQHNLVDYRITTLLRICTSKFSDLFNIKLTKGDDEIYMMARVAAADDNVRSQVRKYYKTEEFGYTKLAKLYERLQEEHDVPQEHRLSFAKCYGCKPDICEETIVWENPRKDGYKTLVCKEYYWDYAKSAVSELAKMHALSFAYGVYYPEEFNKVVHEHKFKWDPTDEQKLAEINTLVNRALAITKKEHKEKLRRFFQPFDIDRFGEFYKWSKKPVLGHGKFRIENLMYRIREGGTVDIKITDLRHLQATNPIVDLLYFIYTGGSDEDFRAKYYHHLLDHYYAELEAAMKRFHLDHTEVYSRSDFYKELEEKLAFGLTMAVFHVLKNRDEVPELVKKMGLTSKYLGGRNFYVNKFNGIVNDYVKFGVLK